MRFLVDEAVSWLVAQALNEAGHDAVHVRDLGLIGHDDRKILEQAERDGRIVITQDTDFGTLLITSQRRSPSVVLIRMRDGRPSIQASVLLEVLPTIEADLLRGAIAVLGDEAVRVRRIT